MRSIGLVLGIAALCVPALALPILPLGTIDVSYQGYSWELGPTGAYPPSLGQAGNVLHAIGQVIKILDGTAVEIYDPEDEGAEMTFYLHGLVSQGATSGAKDAWLTDYLGGSLEVYFDDTPDYDPATGHDNYSGVTDGLLWLSADVLTFSTQFDDVLGQGSFTGTFQVTGGIAANCLTDVWTWGASTTGDVPAGWTYMHSIVGDLYGECIPEPGTFVLLGSGLLGLVGVAGRRR